MSERNERVKNLLNQTGLNVSKTKVHRNGDRTVTYAMEATDANGNTFVGVGVATRGAKDRFVKAIGHQVAEARAMQDLIIQVNPDLLNKTTRRLAVKRRENRMAEVVTQVLG